MTIREQEVISKAAKLFIGLGASEMFVFGSAAKASFDPIPILIWLSPAYRRSAISQASDLIGRPVDLVDLDDDSGLVRYLGGSGELVRVGQSRREDPLGSR